MIMIDNHIIDNNDNSNDTDNDDNDIRPKAPAACQGIHLNTHFIRLVHVQTHA